jgi:peptidoglycan/xylan/chitin deacetylase (PgdA/CDA1 family)
MKQLTWLQSWLVRSAASVASGKGHDASLLVLIYHRVLPGPDPMLPSEPDAATFRGIVELLADNFNVLPLTEAVERLRSASLPARAVCITFDDGYANNLAVAAPILAERGLPATVFIAAGYLNGGRMFNDTVIETVRRAESTLDLGPLGLGRHELPDIAARRRVVNEILTKIKYLAPDERTLQADRIAETVGASLPDDLMLDDAGVRQLSKLGLEIGAHTVNHPILTRIDAERASWEIRESKHRLEGITGVPITAFAYPNGRPGQDYDAIHVRCVKESGFDVAVSTATGAVRAGDDPYQCPRVAPWDPTSMRFALRMMRHYRARGADRVRSTGEML